MKRRHWRFVWIVIFAEIAASNIAFGIEMGSGWSIFIGLNCAFITAFEIVLDHEARGRGE